MALGYRTVNAKRGILLNQSPAFFNVNKSSFSHYTAVSPLMNSPSIPTSHPDLADRLHGSLFCSLFRFVLVKIEVIRDPLHPNRIAKDDFYLLATRR